MKLKINQEEFKRLLSQATFLTSGDDQEKQYGELVTAHFPGCEEFWREFVVPLTQRIETSDGVLGKNIFPRAGVDLQLTNIASVHYSMFMHLAYAHWHYQNRVPSWLENIYTHLVSACDLAEAVIEKWYLLMLRCQNKKSYYLQELTREEVMVKAGEWYDENYSRAYEHYYSKGKSKLLDLLKGEHHENLLCEYFGDSEARKDYARFTNLLRSFRNAVVHDVKLAVLIDPERNIQYIPNLDKINSYRTWRAVNEIAGKQEIINKDFAEIGHQIQESIQGLEIRLNELWLKLIQDVRDEFYSPERTTLRQMYGIEPSENLNIYFVNIITGMPQENIPYITMSGMYPRSDLLKYYQENGSATYSIQEDNHPQ